MQIILILRTYVLCSFSFFISICLFLKIIYFGFKDQDYRTGTSEEKPSKLIRLSGVPENATKEEVSLSCSFCFFFFFDQLKKNF